MTLKDRIKALFKKKDEPYCQPIAEDYEEDFELSFEDDDDLEEVFEDDWDVSTHPPIYVDKNAVEGKNVLPNLEDCKAEFERDFHPKKAIWGGKPTKAFAKWMEDNNLQDLL